MATERPKLGELAAPEDPLNPAKRVGTMAAPFTTVLQTTDSILRSKGGIENLKIYRELLRDDQVAAAWLQRRLALTSCDTVVEPGAEDALSVEAAEALDAELKALAWDDVTEKMLFSQFYGWGVAEVIWRPNGNRVSFDRIVVRDRARFRFDITGNLYLWTMRGGWELMPDRKFWTITTGADNHDEPYGLGLAHSLYWPVFFKRNDVKFWLMFLEKFGMPTAVAKVPAGMINDPATVQKAVQMLHQIATDAGVVVPDNVVVELLEAARTGSADYGGMFDAMNSAISKIIVGQTMTTDDGSSRAQGEVHERVAQKIVESDSDLLSESFNGGPVKWWTEWNFPGAVPPRVYRHTEPPQDLTERAERDTKIHALGFDPTEEYILENYGEGWEKRETPADPLAMMAGAVARSGPMAPNNEGDPGEEFAESENVALAALRAARRGDQQAMFNAARMFAQDYKTITGRRVQQLLQAAEFSEDPETFTRRMDEILAEQPPESTLEKLKRAIFFGGLLGAMRSNRRPK
jgi:phage gp29-like protein